MAKFTGETEITLEDGRVLVAKLSMNSLCLFEDATGKTANDFLASLEGGKNSTKDIRAFVWAILNLNHPEISLEDAGDILSEVGAEGILIPVIQAAMPETKPGNAKPATRKKA